MSILAQVEGQAGMRAGVTADHRIVTRGGQIPALPQGRTIAGACTRDPGNTPVTRIRAGMMMGVISTVVNSLGTVGYYAPSILGVTTNAEATGSTSIQASAAVVTELLRRCGATGTFKLIGPGSAGGTIITETVAYSAASSTNITVTALTNSFIAGSFICPTDGSENPVTFLPNGWPIQAVDGDGNSVDQMMGHVPINAIIDSSELLPAWPSDASLQAWIVSRLSRDGGGQFIFDHLY